MLIQESNSQALRINCMELEEGSEGKDGILPLFSVTERQRKVSKNEGNPGNACWLSWLIGQDGRGDYNVYAFTYMLYTSCPSKHTQGFLKNMAKEWVSMSLRRDTASMDRVAGWEYVGWTLTYASIHTM